MRTKTLSSTLLITSMALCLGLKAQKKAHTFTVSRTINASVDQVWAVVGEDFGAIANSHPRIISSDYEPGTLKSGEGAERRCNLNESGSKYIKEKQVEYDPENYRFKAAIYHVSGLPLTADPEINYGIYRVEPLTDGTCKLSMDLSIRTKPAFLGGIAKGKFKKQLQDYMIAVEHHVLTGEKVTKDNFKAIKKKYTT